MRLSRGCYDKYWRCPGWAGGGLTHPRKQTCDSGTMARIIDWNGRWRWKFHRCPKCGMVVLPYITKKLDPTWWWFKVRFWWRYDVRDWWLERLDIMDYRWRRQAWLNRRAKKDDD